MWYQKSTYSFKWLTGKMSFNNTFRKVVSLICVGLKKYCFKVKIYEWYPWCIQIKQIFLSIFVFFSFFLSFWSLQNVFENNNSTSMTTIPLQCQVFFQKNGQIDIIKSIKFWLKFITHSSNFVTFTFWLDCLSDDTKFWLETLLDSRLKKMYVT